MKRLAILLLLFASSAAAQGIRFSATVTQQTTVNGVPTVTLPVNPSVKFCLHPANAVPCTNVATVYTDQTLSTPCGGGNQIVRDGTNTCVTSPDAQNNWGVWVAPNTLGYDYTITLAGGVNLGPFNVLQQTNNLSGLASVTNLTVSGTGTFTGNNTTKNLNNIRYVDAANVNGWAGTDLAAWITSAFTSMTQQSGTVIVTSGSYATPAASITIGTVGCPNAPSNGWSQTLILDSVQITINNPIKVLCGGYISTNGSNPFGSWITAGASLGSNPMIDVGDAVNGNINAGVSFMRLNCNSQAGCTGIRARGLQDLSFLSYNLIQNYLVNGINVDCSTGAGGGNLTLRGNDVAAATGAADGIVLNACNGAEIDRNTVVSNSGVAITGAGLKIFGNSANQSCMTVANLHNEKHTDAVSVDGAVCVILDGIDVSNVTTQTVHIKSTATGSVFARMVHNNANSGASPVILNDVTTTSRTSNNTPNGVVVDYKWMNNQYELLVDAIGIYTGPGSSGNPVKLLNGFSAPGIATHFNTSGDSISANGSSSFAITVGTGGGTSTGVLNLPTATNGWSCWLVNQTRADLIQSNGGASSVTFTNLGTTFAATNWTNSDVLRGGCYAN